MINRHFSHFAFAFIFCSHHSPPISVATALYQHPISPVGFVGWTTYNSTMWLIDTETLTLKFFSGPPERYAILSHMWGDSSQEVTFQQFTQGGEDVKAKAGYTKIRECCRIAKSEGFQYAWVDTCCIDKTSSAELSESINSMFAWYKSSTVCYAYLWDIESTTSTIQPGGAPSRWYSRGWTLQELVAPLKVVFFNLHWHQIGTKWSLRREISAMTGIDERDLVFFEHGRASVAQKMSWAARRQTTREEDAAYCLLGIFDIHMPLLYGEGRGAFRRFQQELIKTSPDQSIFAWTHPVWQEDLPWGMLANSPASFEHCGSLASSRPHDDRSPKRHDGRRTSYALTNTGLEIGLPIIENFSNLNARVRHNPDLELSKLLAGKFEDTAADGSRVRHVLGVLDCFSEDGYAICIILTGYEGSHSFHRLFYDYLVEVSPEWVDQEEHDTISVALESKWFVSRGPWQLREKEYSAQVFIHPSIALNRFQLHSPSFTSEITLKDGGFCMQLTYGTAATLDIIVNGQRCAIYFGILSAGRYGPPWLVYCNVSTDFSRDPTLDICKKRLGHGGEPRRDQDGSWMKPQLPNGALVSVSVYNIARAQSEQRDLVYIGHEGRASTTLSPNHAEASELSGLLDALPPLPASRPTSPVAQPKSQYYPPPAAKVYSPPPSHSPWSPTPQQQHYPPPAPPIYEALASYRPTSPSQAQSPYPASFYGHRIPGNTDFQYDLPAFGRPPVHLAYMGYEMPKAPVEDTSAFV